MKPVCYSAFGIYRNTVALVDVFPALYQDNIITVYLLCVCVGCIA